MIEKIFINIADFIRFYGGCLLSLIITFGLFYLFLFKIPFSATIGMLLTSLIAMTIFLYLFMYILHCYICHKRYHSIMQEAMNQKIGKDFPIFAFILNNYVEFGRILTFTYLQKEQQYNLDTVDKKAKNIFRLILFLYELTLLCIVFTLLTFFYMLFVRGDF